MRISTLFSPPSLKIYERNTAFDFMLRFHPVAIAVVVVALSFDACSPKAARTGIAPSPRLSAIIVDDRKSGATLNAFSYVGRWERVTGRRDGRYEGTSIRSFTPGDIISTMFYGRRFDLHGVCGPRGGSATLALDGHIHTISFLAHAKTMELVYSSGPLRDGLHSVVVVVGTKPKGIAPTGYVNIDYARIER
jgi:hypothetical protein